MESGDELYFGPFRLDLANACVWRGQTPVLLTPKAFDLLRYLVTHAGRLVSEHKQKVELRFRVVLPFVFLGVRCR
jgi:DNA-binding response OmpR family regulator